MIFFKIITITKVFFQLCQDNVRLEGARSKKTAGLKKLLLKKYSTIQHFAAG